MSERDIARLREKLLKKRQKIFEWRQRFESDWQALSERDIELEEEAQKADIASHFDQLNIRAKEEIEEIDLALCRITAGSYGICEGCQWLISLKRLEALPPARLCRKCARRYEEKQKKLPGAREMITCAELPDEYQDLDNEELKMVILEHISDDGRVDLKELKISCQNGVIYLKGAVPSENERQILLRILTDVIGLTSVVDYLQADKILWEREDRSPGRAPLALDVDTDEIADDVFESEEKEVPYTFPDRPPPEKV